MEINDMVMVSVDDHVVEPPDLFEGRLPAKYVDLAPKFVTNEDGAQKTGAVFRHDQLFVNLPALIDERIHPGTGRCCVCIAD